MTAISIMQQNGISLRKSLRYSGCSSTMYYYKRKPRNRRVDPAILDMIQEIAAHRPSYGTRRMAAILSKEMGRPINRKQVRRIFYTLNWLKPAQKKQDIIKAAAKKPVLPSGPGQLWEADMTYVWCGIDGWCYLFNVIDVFTRQWVGYSFDTTASKESAIQSIVNSIATSKTDTGRLRLRVDNGSQYRSKRFTDSMKALGVQVEFIHVHTPEQNGHIESFHKTLKKEYIWTRDFASYQQANETIRMAYQDYNHSRIHSALGYRTPEEFVKSLEMTNK